MRLARPTDDAGPQADSMQAELSALKQAALNMFDVITADESSCTDAVTLISPLMLSVHAGHGQEWFWQAEKG